MSQEKTVAVKINVFNDIQDAVELELSKAATKAEEKLVNISSHKQDTPKNLDPTQLYLHQFVLYTLLSLTA